MKTLFTALVLTCTASVLAAEKPAAPAAKAPAAKAPAAKSAARAAAKPAAKPAVGQWIELFDGRTLKGWMIMSGFAQYRVEDGAIVGRTAEFSGNTFLCSDKSFDDFILEFEVKCDPALNSGVQFRGQVYPKHTTWEVEKDGKVQKRSAPAGRVYGYQVEVANEASQASGGVYDEARRGCWLYEAAKNPPDRRPYKEAQWNQYRVVCQGPSIKTWINGVPVADFKDDADAGGFIGLQVHGVKGDPKLEVRFRNIRIQPLK